MLTYILSCAERHLTQRKQLKILCKNILHRRKNSSGKNDNFWKIYEPQTTQNKSLIFKLSGELLFSHQANPHVHQQHIVLVDVLWICLMIMISQQEPSFVSHDFLQRTLIVITMITNDAMGDTKMFLFFSNVSTINAFVSEIVFYGMGTAVDLIDVNYCSHSIKALIVQTFEKNI